MHFYGYPSSADTKAPHDLFKKLYNLPVFTYTSLALLCMCGLEHHLSDSGEYFFCPLGILLVLSALPISQDS